MFIRTFLVFSSIFCPLVALSEQKSLPIKQNGFQQDLVHDMNLAESTLDFIKSQTIDLSIGANLGAEHYKSAPRRFQENRNKSFYGYVSIGIGNNSNANHGSSSSTFLGLTLSDESRKTESPVYFAMVGATYNKSKNNIYNIYVNGNSYSRSYTNASNVDSQDYDGSIEIQFLKSRTSFISTKIQTGSINIDEKFDHHETSFSTSYFHAISKNRQILTRLDIGRVTFRSEVSIKDGDYALIQGSWHEHFNFSFPTTLQYALLYGEYFTDVSFSVHKREIIGMQFDAETNLSARLKLVSSLSTTQHKYKNKWFNVNRKDTLLNIIVGTIWQHKKISYRPMINYETNSSDLTLYEYSKTVLQLIVRYDF